MDAPPRRCGWRAGRDLPQRIAIRAGGVVTESPTRRLAAGFHDSALGRGRNNAQSSCARLEPDERATGLPPPRPVAPDRSVLRGKQVSPEREATYCFLNTAPC